MRRIALMRHFPTGWNQANRVQGQTDIPLTEASRRTLHNLAIPEPWSRSRIIASPLRRAAETARILARGEPLWHDARLMELNYGEWEGRRKHELLADPQSGYIHIEQGGWHRAAPGGESPWDVWERVRPLLAELASEAMPVLLIAHRALIRVVLARAWNWDYQSPQPFKIVRGRLYPLTLLPDGSPTEPEAAVQLVPVQRPEDDVRIPARVSSSYQSDHLCADTPLDLKPEGVASPVMGRGTAA